MLAWLTIDDPGELVSRGLSIPVGFLPHLMGAIGELTNAGNWEKQGTLTPQECADMMSLVWESVGSLDMIGSIQYFGTADLPSSYLPCDGGVYNRVDYPQLYSLIDPTLIIDADTFNTPPIMDRFILSEGNDYVFGGTGGEASHSLNAAENGQHNHTIQRGFGPDVAASIVLGALEGLEAIPTEETTSDSGLGDAHNNMPPYWVGRVGIRWCI